MIGLASHTCRPKVCCCVNVAALAVFEIPNALYNHRDLDARERVPPLAMKGRNSTNISPARFCGSNPPKTPKKRKSPPLDETPRHGRLASTLPFTSTAIYRDFAFVAAANEVKNKFVGGVAPSVFLDVFLPKCSSKMPMVNKASFKKVSEKGKEVEMYDPLVRVVLLLMTKDTHWL